MKSEWLPIFNTPRIQSISFSKLKGFNFMRFYCSGFLLEIKIPPQNSILEYKENRFEGTSIFDVFRQLNDFFKVENTKSDSIKVLSGHGPRPFLDVIHTHFDTGVSDLRFCYKGFLLIVKTPISPVEIRYRKVKLSGDSLSDAFKKFHKHLGYDQVGVEDDE